MQYIFIGIIVVLAIVVGILIYKIKGESKESCPGTILISSGVGLIVSSFPSLSNRLIDLISACLHIDFGSNSNEMYISIGCGFVLIIMGIFYNKNIKDRFYIFNMFSKDKIFIGQHPNYNDLKLVDFKIREHIVDIVRAFNEGKDMTLEKCNYIAEEIREKAECFLNQSKECNKGFTGMAPIPFTILAGTFLSGTEIDRYFEYNMFNKRYYELKKSKIKKNKIQPLVVNQQVRDSNSKDVLVTLAITIKPLDSDLIQFNNMDSINIEMIEPKNNAIVYKQQLDLYTKQIVDELVNLSSLYPKLERIHLVAAIPSCISIELGRLISKNRNRLPQIISYHYIRGNSPRYAFGIVITENEKGKLIEQ